MCCRFCQIVCAFFAPPLAVMCHSGCTSDLLINVILTCCGVIPGMIHAVFVICSENKQSLRVTTNVNVAAPSIPMYQPVMPMYQPVAPPPAPVYYPEPSPAPPVYYPDPGQKF
ncbi:hypothetical protein RB195_020508 [Necator americanus]